MKDFKFLLLFSFLLFFFQCKKDKKSDVQANLLPNGKYILYLEEDSQSHSSCYYYLENDIFYVLRRYTQDTICLSRKAGELFLNTSGELVLTPLQMGISSNPCVFANDLYGGDTMVIHLSNITEATSNFGKKYIKGDYYNLVRSGLPFSISEGIFTLGPS